MKTSEKIILVCLPEDRFGPAHRERLAGAAGGRRIIASNDRGEIEKLIEDVEICIGFGPWDIFAKMPNLAWIQAWGAGVDQLVENPAIIDKPLVVTNTSGIHKEQLAEHIFGMILAYNRKFPLVFAAQKKHEWLKIYDRETMVLSGKTMLILGYGSIGEYCARVAKSFDMKVIALRRHKPETAAGVRIETSDKLHSVLPEADYVVNILPYTRETLKFMAAGEFGIMKKSAIYVNAGRGPTTDETALVQALKSGTIAAALLDVTTEEPLAKDSPLWDMENVIITPHFAGLRPDYSAMAMDITMENLSRYNRGETLINLVEKNAGY